MSDDAAAKRSGSSVQQPDEQAWLASVVQNSNDAIYGLDLKRRIVSWNPAAERIYGYAAEEATGRRIDMLVPSDRLDEMLDILSRTRRGERISHFETVRLRKDGTPVPMSLTVSPVADANNRLSGYSVVARDITQRKQAEEELLRHTQLMRAITDNATSALFMLDRRGRPTFMNPAAMAMTGFTLDEIQGAPLHDAIHHHHPDGRPYPIADCPIDRSSETLRPIRDHEDMFIRKDGTFFPVSCSVAPLEQNSVQVGAVLEVVDITERRRAERQQRILVAELSHRVKNTLAAVLAIAMQTERNAATVEEFAGSFKGRIQALAQTHSLLAENNWGGAQIRDVVGAELRPYADGPGRNVTVTGDALSVNPKAALTLALVIHELATNAVKHGSLSVPDGRVDVDWRIGGSKGARRLDLTWRESGGPPAAPPTRRGFGRSVIERSVAYELDGNATLSFRPGGLVCRLKVPLARVVHRPELPGAAPQGADRQ